MPDKQYWREAVEKLDPTTLEHYAQMTGWWKVENIPDTVALYRRPESELDEILIPKDRSFADFSRQMASVVQFLAEFEDRSVLAVLNDILLPPSEYDCVEALAIRLTSAAYSCAAESGEVQAEGVLEEIEHMSIETRKRIALAKARKHQRAARAALDKPAESYDRGAQDQKRAVSIAINCLGHALSELEELANQEHEIAVSGTLSLRDYCKRHGFNPETAIRAAGRGDIPGAAKIDGVWRVPEGCTWSPKAEGRPRLHQFVCANCQKKTETYAPLKFEIGFVCDGCARTHPEAIR